MSAPQRVRFFGVSIDPWTMEETIAEIGRRLDAAEFTQHVVVNVAKIVNMRQDTSLAEAIRSCDIINVDGMGVVWGARFLGLDIPERVTGIDLFLRLLDLASNRGSSVFFLGATPQVVERAVSNLRDRYPSLKVAGWYHGYFWENEHAIVENIFQSRATLLFVGMTSPQKEHFINRYRDRLGVTFAMGVGGAFDIVAGRIPRAPSWMQQAGLEWLFRVIQEPRRMWKRYIVTNSKYAWMLLNERLGQRWRC